MDKTTRIKLTEVYKMIKDADLDRGIVKFKRISLFGKYLIYGLDRNNNIKLFTSMDKSQLQITKAH